MTPLAFPNWSVELRNAFDEGARATTWSRPFEAAARQAMGRFLGWLAQDLLGRTLCDLLTPATLAAYVEAHVLLGSPAGSIVAYVDRLVYAALVMEPQADWIWLTQQKRALRKRLLPRSKGASRQQRQRSREDLPVAEWPVQLQEAWLALLELRSGKRPAGRYRQRRHLQSPALTWSQAYVRRIERGLCLWTRHARDHQLPALPTLDAMAQWLDALSDAGKSPVTVAMHAEELARGMQVMFPDRDWTGIGDFANAVKREAKPIGDVAARLVDVNDLDRLAMRLMKQARSMPRGPEAATKFRTGLLIGLVTRRPDRVSDIARMRIGQEVEVADNGINFDYKTSKTGETVHRSAPACLTGAIREWLEVFRPVIAIQDTDAFWIGRDGAPLTAGTISDTIREATRTAFGKHLSTHDLRDVFATSLTARDPGAVGLAAKVLTQRNKETASRHYIHGLSVSASVEVERLSAYYDVPVLRTK